MIVREETGNTITCDGEIIVEEITMPVAQRKNQNLEAISLR